jgi:formylglycine-generating enzyme required for sulfatase activity
MWLVRGDLVPIGGGLSGQPVYEADIGSFYISRACLSNEAYQAFRPDFQPSPSSPGPEDAAVGLSFADAVAYCVWWSHVTHKNFRLPTEQEWELACGGGKDQRYPWGDEPSDGGPMAFTAENTQGTCPAMEGLVPNDQGIWGMIGGVWEWTSTRLGDFPVDDREDRDALEPPGERVLRGGSFKDPIAALGTRIRRGAMESFAADDLGFRIVRSL